MVLVPMRLPAVWASAQGMPMSQTTGLMIQPRMRCRVRGAPATSGGQGEGGVAQRDDEGHQDDKHGHDADEDVDAVHSAVGDGVHGGHGGSGGYGAALGSLFGLGHHDARDEDGCRGGDDAGGQDLAHGVGDGGREDGGVEYEHGPGDGGHAAGHEREEFAAGSCGAR